MIRYSSSPEFRRAVVGCFVMVAAVVALTCGSFAQEQKPSPNDTPPPQNLPDDTLSAKVRGVITNIPAGIPADLKNLALNPSATRVDSGPVLVSKDGITWSEARRATLLAAPFAVRAAGPERIQFLPAHWRFSMGFGTNSVVVVESAYEVHGEGTTLVRSRLIKGEAVYKVTHGLLGYAPLQIRASNILLSVQDGSGKIYDDGTVECVSGRAYASWDDWHWQLQPGQRYVPHLPELPQAALDRSHLESARQIMEQAAKDDTGDLKEANPARPSANLHWDGGTFLSINLTNWQSVPAATRTPGPVIGSAITPWRSIAPGFALKTTDGLAVVGFFGGGAIRIESHSVVAVESLHSFPPLTNRQLRATLIAGTVKYSVIEKLPVVPLRLRAAGVDVHVQDGAGSIEAGGAVHCESGQVKIMRSGEAERWLKAGESYRLPAP